MPSQDFEVAPEEPLFTDEDPLTISLPGVKGAEAGSPEAGGKWRALDRANFPLEDGWENRQISYLVEAMRLQVCCDNIECASGQNTDCEHDEARATFEASLVRNYELSRISITNIGDMMRWLQEEREKAEKGAVSRKVKRPTGGRRRSTP